MEEVAAGGSSTKALDPCLETGEVGEGPARPPRPEKEEIFRQKAAARHSMSLGHRSC